MKRILDSLVIGLFVLAVFGFGWSLAGRVLDFKEASKNFEAVVYQSKISAELIQGLGAGNIGREDLRLIFVGDIMLGRGVAYQVQKNGGDFRFPFLLVKDFLESVDLVFGNLEGPISDKGKNQGSIYSFRFSPEAVEGLIFAGFDAVSLANNHIWDWGSEALLDTVEILNNAGIKVIGAGRNYEEANKTEIFEIGGTRIAFLAYTDLYPKSLRASEDYPGMSDFDLEKVKMAVAEAREAVDLVVVSWHWGEEYQTHSNLHQQEIAHALIDAGADLVVGHHSHVPQEIEKYNGAFVVYSLGNFVFDQNFSEETMGGLALEVAVKAKKIQEVRPVYFKINSHFQPYFEE